MLIGVRVGGQWYSGSLMTLNAFTGSDSTTSVLAFSSHGRFKQGDVTQHGADKIY